MGEPKKYRVGVTRNVQAWIILVPCVIFTSRDLESENLQSVRSIRRFVAGVVRIHFPKSRGERKTLKVNKTEQVFLLVKSDSKEIWVGIGHWRRLPKPGKPKSETPRGLFFPKEPPGTRGRGIGRRCAIASYISPAGSDSTKAGNLMKARRVSVDFSGRAES